MGLGEVNISQGKVYFQA